MAMRVPMMEENVQEAVKNNIFGLMNLFETTENNGCESFALISSGKAVNLTSVMGATKPVGELILSCRSGSAMRCISVRFGNVLGSNGSVVPVLQQQLENNRPLTITHPEIKRFFMTTREAVALVLEASTVGEHGDILPGGPQTLQNFIEKTYLPYARAHKRPSTFKGYSNIYSLYVATRVAGVKLWQFRTVDCQRLLDAIASSKPLSNSSLFNIKTFLSAVFAEAKRLGVLDGVNPVQGVRVPKGQPGKTTYAYSPQEINKLAAVLKGHARTAVIVAAYTGLSLAELKGCNGRHCG
jgi:hypothetical protein